MLILLHVVIHKLLSLARATIILIRQLNIFLRFNVSFSVPFPDLFVDYWHMFFTVIGTFIAMVALFGVGCLLLVVS